MTKIPEEAVERMEALVRRAASHRADFAHIAEISDEARAIVAMLPEPVDPLLIEAREWAASRTEARTEYAAEIRRGDHDCASADLIGYLAGARAQQAKLTPTVEPDADGWIPHKPGDPMPCDGDTLVDAKLQNGSVSRRWRAIHFDWSVEPSSATKINAWRPAR